MAFSEMKKNSAKIFNSKTMLEMCLQRLGKKHIGGKRQDLKLGT